MLLLLSGANTGVGRETALQLALHGATVIIGCRNANKGSQAVAYIQQELKRADQSTHPFAMIGKVECIILDLSCFFSVKEFVTKFEEKYKHLDVLVNNGGLNLKSVNKNGLQELFMVNYLSHYLLFRLLEPSLSTSPSEISLTTEYVPQEARVVNLSSVMHHEGNSEFEKSAFSRYSAAESYSYYSDSKLYLNYLTIEINRRYGLSRRSDSHDEQEGRKKKRRITAISVNPGAVRSDIWRHVPWPISYPYDLVMRLLYLNVEEGAAPSLFAATVPFPQSRSLLPYVCPYRVHGNILAFEMLGPFGGATWATPTLPNKASEKAKELYLFSESLINSLVSSESEDKYVDKKFRLDAAD